MNVWQVTGPFSKEGVEGLDLFNLKFEPEINENYSNWKEMPVGKDGYEANVINLEKYFDEMHCVAYLKTNIWSEKSQKVLLELGSDDGIKVWFNDKLVHHKNIERGHNQGQDVAEVNFEEGWNTVLMKITQGTGGWAASLVVTDLEHKPLNGLRYKL